MKTRAVVSRLLFPTLLLALAVTACDQQEFFDQFVPAEEAGVAKDLVAKLREKDFAAVEARLGDDLRTADVSQKLEELAGQLPTEKPESIRTVGSDTVVEKSATTYNLTLEYEYPHRWLLVNTLLVRRDGKLAVEGIHFAAIQQSLEETNKFSFDNKGPLHFVLFALLIGIPLFVIYALVVCARTPIPRRKWLWLLFVAVGVTQFHFNWTTAAWDVQPIAVSLLGAGFVKMGPVAPWVLTLSLPIGAFVFLGKRRSFQESHEQSSTRTPAVDSN